MSITSYNIFLWVALNFTNGEGPSTVTEWQQFLPPPPDAVFFFGNSLAVDDGGIFVSSPGEDDGVVHVYEQRPAGWNEVARVVPPGNPAGVLSFGAALACDDGWLTVGATRAENDQGLETGGLYVFQDGPTGWTFEQRLIGTHLDQYDGFGASAAIDGDTLAVGAPAADGPFSQSGRVYVFRRTSSRWVQEAVLTGSWATPSGVFGYDLDLEGDTLVVGGPSEDGPELLSGSVTIFEREESGWVETQVFAAPDADFGDSFGRSVAISGDRFVAGARRDDDLALNAGAAWVYRRTGEGWQPEAKLLMNPGGASSFYGEAVAFDGSTVLVGGRPPVQGSGIVAEVSRKVFQFRLADGVWSQVAVLEPSTGTDPDQFGSVLALDGGIAVAGAWSDSTLAPGNGAAYLYLLEVPPATHCTAKASSAGCLPAIGWSGSPSLSGTDDLVVTATGTAPAKPGLLFWSRNGPAATPFLGGTLCVTPPLVRTPPQLSAGGDPCGGSYAFAFAPAYAASQGLPPGLRVDLQWWMRDPLHPDGTGVLTSDALEVWLAP